MKLNEKINVLFMLIQLGMGGSEKVVLELARHMDPTKFNVYLAYFFGGHLESEFRQVCRKIFHVTKKDGFDFFAMLKISKLIYENHINVINAHHFMPFFYGYLGSKVLHKRGLVYTEHSVPEVDMILKSKHLRIFRYMLRNTDCVVGISREVYKTFKDALPEYSHKFMNINNGVDINRFVFSVDREKIRCKWGLSTDHFVIGTVANFRRVKNHVCLIRAFNQIADIYPHVRMVFVGQGFPDDEENSERDVMDMINAFQLQDKIILTGYQEDIPGLLKTFDVFCMPSFSEGLPVSILEAMSARIPVVGSNVQGIREVISSEKTGLLFPTNDNNGLVKALESIINNSYLREKISNNAFEYVNREHGLQQWISTYEQLFRMKN